MQGGARPSHDQVTSLPYDRGWSRQGLTNRRVRFETSESSVPDQTQLHKCAKLVAFILTGRKCQLPSSMSTTCSPIGRVTIGLALGAVRRLPCSVL